MQKKQVLVSIMGWTRDDEGLDDPMRLLTTGTLTVTVTVGAWEGPFTSLTV